MIVEGSRVKVRSTGELGTVRYVGPLAGKDGVFFGVELDRASGKNDGSLGGKRYFECERNHGTFVRDSNLENERQQSSSSRGVSRNRGSREDSSQSGPLSKYSAARSHEHSEAYMENFHKGMRELALAHGGSYDEEAVESKVGLFQQDFGGAFDPMGIPQHSTDWSRGPQNPEGTLFDASDQPLLCAALSPDGSEFVVGGCDHGLRVFDLITGKEKRNLYTKRHGHHEWVTGCSYLPNGAILSAGMDSKMCLWKGAQCTDLQGHRGSISRMIVTKSGRHCISCSYDKTIRIWDLGSKSEQACFTGHKAPILDMVLSDGIVVSGSRDGMALAWDLGAGEPHKLNEGNHNGHVTSLHASGTRQFLSGDQAGVVRLWDLRQRGTKAQKANVHAGGAVNAIKHTQDGRIVSAGADKRVVVSDPRMLGEPVLELTHHKDFIYSLLVTSEYILSGAGDGLLLVHSLGTGKLCYGLGANAAAIRCILATPSGDALVAAGDDGKAMSYHF